MTTDRHLALMALMNAIEEPAKIYHRSVRQAARASSDSPDFDQAVGRGNAALDSIEQAVRRWTAKHLAGEVDELQALRARVAELEAFAHGCDGEGCVLPHSSWCERAQKTAAENEGCTCGQPWAGHPQPHSGHCWLLSPPRAEVEKLRRALAARPATPSV